MRQIALIILIILGVTGYFFVKQRAQVLSPVSTDIHAVSLSKALNGVVTVEYSDRLIASVSGITVIFPKSDNYDNLVRALQMVLNRATMENKPVEIDLRFNKPVLRYGT